MTYEEMDALLAQMHAEEREVRAAGHVEYSGAGADTLAQFKELARLTGTSPLQVALVFAQKHFAGIAAYVRGARSQREDVRGRIKDLRTYLALLRGLIEEGERALAQGDGDVGARADEPWGGR